MIIYLKSFSSNIIEYAMSIAKENDYFKDVLALKIKKYGESLITDGELKQKALGFPVRKAFDFGLSNKALMMNPADFEYYLKNDNF
jgi:SOS response regulatory protein OraA/RecX